MDAVSPHVDDVVHPGQVALGDCRYSCWQAVVSRVTPTPTARHWVPAATRVVSLASPRRDVASTSATYAIASIRRAPPAISSRPPPAPHDSTPLVTLVHLDWAALAPPPCCDGADGAGFSPPLELSAPHAVQASEPVPSAVRAPLERSRYIRTVPRFVTAVQAAVTDYLANDETSVRQGSTSASERQVAINGKPT